MTNPLHHRPQLLLSLTLALAAAAPRRSAAAGSPPSPNPHSAIQNPQSPTPLAQYAAARLDAALDTAKSGNLKRAKLDAATTLALLAAYGTDADADTFRRAAYTRRLLLTLDATDPATAKALLPYLLAHQELGAAIAFAMPSTEKAKTAYPLLARLIKERPQVVDRLPNLAAAIALVHDTPLERQINENRVKSADPVPILDYFAGNESRMEFGLRDVPVDLLVYVVDTTSSIPDLNWALSRYQGNRNVGQLFFNVRYDYNAYYTASAKEVTKRGYTLPNIAAYGGVCADQAYFATEVAKAIGVPSAYTRGTSADLSHAWVGFLQPDPRTGRAAWNFDTGRYDVYKNVRGDVTDPVTRQFIPDSYVSLLAASLSADPTPRQTAAAFTDAALLLFPQAATSTIAPTTPENAPHPAARAAGVPPASPIPALPPELPSNLSARDRSAQSALELIELGLRHAESYPAGWTAVARLASTGQMTLDQKRRWADLVQKLCGRSYPDFAVAILDPMIRSVDDPAEQSRMWTSIYNTYQLSRPDLAAQARLRQGEAWEKAGNLPKAGQAYEEVIRRFVNTSPYALPAVERCEAVLKQMGQSDKVLLLYKQAASAVMRPADGAAPEFQHQSNWYKLKSAYAKKLEEAGRIEEARQVLPADTARPSSPR